MRVKLRTMSWKAHMNRSAFTGTRLLSLIHCQQLNLEIMPAATRNKVIPLAYRSFGGSTVLRAYHLAESYGLPPRLVDHGVRLHVRA